MLKKQVESSKRSSRYCFRKNRNRIIEFESAVNIWSQSVKIAYLIHYKIIKFITTSIPLKRLILPSKTQKLNFTTMHEGLKYKKEFT